MNNKVFTYEGYLTEAKLGVLLQGMCDLKGFTLHQQFKFGQKYKGDYVIETTKK